MTQIDFRYKTLTATSAAATQRGPSIGFFGKSILILPKIPLSMSVSAAGSLSCLLTNRLTVLLLDIASEINVVSIYFCQKML